MNLSAISHLKVMSASEISARQACSSGMTSFHEVGAKSKRKMSQMMMVALKDLKERSFIPPMFPCLDVMWRELNLQAIKPAKHCWWRLTNTLLAKYRSLPISGLLIATDGHQCVLVKEDGSVFVGLLCNVEMQEKLEMPNQDFESYNGKAIVNGVRAWPTKRVGRMPKENIFADFSLD